MGDQEPLPGSLHPVGPPVPGLREREIQLMRHQFEPGVATPVDQADAKRCAQRVKRHMDEFLALLPRLENADVRAFFKSHVDDETRGHLPEDLARVHPLDVEKWLDDCDSSLARLQGYMEDLRSSLVEQTLSSNSSSPSQPSSASAQHGASFHGTPSLSSSSSARHEASFRGTPSLSSSPSASSFSSSSQRESSPPPAPRAPSPPPAPRAALARPVPQAPLGWRTSCRSKYRRETCSKDPSCVWQAGAMTAKRHMIFHAFNVLSHASSGFWTRGVCRDASPEERARQGKLGS